jgi:hypothetical protein
MSCTLRIQSITTPSIAVSNPHDVGALVIAITNVH